MFPYFPKSFKRKIETALDVLWADSLKNLETLETFPQTLVNSPLTWFGKWKQFGNTEDQMETSDLPSDFNATNATNDINCPTESKSVKEALRCGPKRPWLGRLTDLRRW